MRAPTFSTGAVLLLLVLMPTSANAALININTASLNELDTLPGVGPAIAQRIIDGRPYAAVTEISNVQGIGGPGSSTYENIISLITVGDISPPQSENSASETTPSTSSVHYGATPISNVDKRTVMHVSAGRDRLGTAGSPLEFLAETNFDYTKSSIFSWNFGDGSTGSGSIVNHTYDYPGEYTVILTVDSPQGQAIARVNAKITDPALEITLATPQRIELKNNSKEEANLYGRGLWSGNLAFLFPKDTIIKAGQKISFSSKVTGLSPNAMSEVQPIVVGDTEQPKIGLRIAEEKANKIAYIQNELAILRQQMAGISQPAAAPSLNKEQSARQPVLEEEIFESAALEPQTAAAKDGWLGFIKRFFLRTK